MNTQIEIEIRQATIDDVEAVAPLFDAYRQFYAQGSDLELAHRFLSERMMHNESIVFIATNAKAQGQNAAVLGFVQLYPTFSSISARHSFILNDLFVLPTARGCGVGRLLLQAATQYGRDTGAVYLQLETAKDNHLAQSLYASQGWVRDTEFYIYTLML